MAAAPLVYRTGALANNGQSSTDNIVPITIPGTCLAGDIAVFSFSTNLTSMTITVPTGWLLMAGAPLVQGTTLAGYSYYKVLSAADIGSTRTWRTSSSGHAC